MECRAPQGTPPPPPQWGGQIQPDWDALRDKWQITYKDLDYTVLNFLCKKTTEEQDNILASLAALDLRGIHNLSAYLSSMIQKHGGNHSPSSRKGDVRRTYTGRHGHVYRALSPDLSPELVPQQEPTLNPEVAMGSGLCNVDNFFDGQWW